MGMTNDLPSEALLTAREAAAAIHGLDINDESWQTGSRLPEHPRLLYVAAVKAYGLGYQAGKMEGPIYGAAKEEELSAVELRVARMQLADERAKYTIELEAQLVDTFETGREEGAAVTEAKYATLVEAANEALPWLDKKGYVLIKKALAALKEQEQEG